MKVWSEIYYIKQNRDKIDYAEFKIECPFCLLNNRIRFHYENNKFLKTKTFCKFCYHLLSFNYDDIEKQIERYLKEQKEKMDIKIEKGMEIEDGKHVGEIMDVKESHYSKGENEFSYLDVFISVDELVNKDGNKVTLKAGFPLPATTSSGLGKFLKNMGLWSEEGETVKNVEKSLIGLPVSYLTIKETGKDGKEYTNIVKKSLKLRG